MNYIKYEIYFCPEEPTKCGEYYGSTPILEQALGVISHLAKIGRCAFVCGITENGEKVIFL